jgi:hypothetical protein
VNPVIFRPSFFLLPVMGLAALTFWPHPTLAQSVEAVAENATTVKESKAAAKDWKPLAGSWVVSQFGGDGPVEIMEDQILLGIGDPLTGVRWKGELLRENFEIELEARRVEGFDFFCGLTFPVGESNVSLILGGWGGGVVGISSIDGRDASENETTSFRNFDNNQWYKVRVRVDSHEIRAWIDDQQACAHPRKDHKFSIRYEMDQCVPLGLAAFQSKSELRGIRVRKLTEDEIGQAKQKSESAD